MNKSINIKLEPLDKWFTLLANELGKINIDLEPTAAFQSGFFIIKNNKTIGLFTNTKLFQNDYYICL